MLMLKTKRATVVLLLGGLITTGAILLVWQDSAVRRAQRQLALLESRLGKQQGLQILTTPDRVHAYRIGPITTFIDAGIAKPDDYPVQSGPVEVSPEVAASLRRLLYRPENYDWPDVPEGMEVTVSCSPRHGFRYAFIGQVSVKSGHPDKGGLL